MIDRLYKWCFGYVGSTRPAALIRIGLAMLLLYRFTIAAQLIRPHHGIIVFALFVIAALCMLVGLRAQLATFVAGAIGFGSWYFYGALLMGGSRLGTAFWHHNTYILSFATLLLSLAPCGRSFSIDRLLARRRAERAGAPPPAEEGDLFAMRLIAIQMAALYFFAFWDKVVIQGSNALFTAFLNGDRLQAIILNFYWGSGFQVPAYAGYVAAAASISVALIELALPLLLVERLQKWLIPFGVLLHVAFYALLSLATYSLTCLLLYLAIIDANKTHGLLEALGSRLPRLRPRAGAPAMA